MFAPPPNKQEDVRNGQKVYLPKHSFIALVPQADWRWNIDVHKLFGITGQLS